MNRKQFVILVVILIVLGGAGWWVQMNRNRADSAGEQGTGQKLLGDAFPVNDVALISIKQGTNGVTLIKKSDLWRVQERNDYPASYQQISEFLLKARDLKVVQTEDVGASQLPRLQLAAAGQGTNSGVMVDLQNKDGKTIKAVTLGKMHMRKPSQQQAAQFGEEGFPDGRYVMVAGDSHKALLISDSLDGVQPKAESWLDKDFFKVERPKAISVAYPETTNSWKLSRDSDTGDWKLAEARPAEKLDTGKVAALSNPFSAPSFEDVVLVGSMPGGTGLDKPTVVTVDTFDDFIYTVKVGTKSGDAYATTVTASANFPKERTPAKDEKPEDKTKADKAWADRKKQLQDKLKHEQAFANWTYLVPAWNMESILKVRKDLLEEKKEEPKPTAEATTPGTEIAPAFNPAPATQK